MKKIGLFCLVVLTLMACKKESGYVVHGKFNGAPEGTIVYLGKDSTKIINGEFQFKGQTDFPLLYELKVSTLNEYGYPDFKGTLLWVENQEIQVESPWEELSYVYGYSPAMKISGSELNTLYREYQKQIREIGAPRDSLWEIYQEAYMEPLLKNEPVDVDTGMKAMREIREIAAKKRQFAQDFIAQNPSSPASVDILTWQLQGQNYTVEEARRMINSLDTSLKTIPAYQNLMKAFEDFRPTAKGEKYIDVTLTDKDGKEVKLSEIVQPGKYNMLEFWASWCGPCRGEIPHLRHVHNVCGKDFNIISISIDEKEEAWRKAMEEEKMVWVQLRDAKSWNGGASQIYKVQGVPYSLVLDGEGRIITGDVRGAELDIVLTELLGEKAKGL